MMTVEYDINGFVFLNHKGNIDEIYENTVVDDTVTSYELTGKLFSILDVNKPIGRKRKRPNDAEELHDEALKLDQLYKRFLNEVSETHRENLTKSYTKTDTSNVRDLARKLFENTMFDHAGLSGGNNSNLSIKSKIKDEHFLLPPNSKFHCGCVKEQCTKLDGNKYDILIADPPWWNKYIRRLKGANDKLSYNMMYNEEIASIPIENLLAPNCLVAVWCTNSPNNINAVKSLIFPRWGVTYLTTWYWLKVTVDFKPLRPFAPGLKTQPFERLMIGKVGDVNVPETKLIISVPSALHSHKPPLLDIDGTLEKDIGKHIFGSVIQETPTGTMRGTADLLKAYVKSENPDTLELFARYLLPNTTSVGYEPLKWQHISLYEEVSNKNNQNK